MPKTGPQVKRPKAKSRTPKSSSQPETPRQNVQQSAASDDDDQDDPVRESGDSGLAFERDEVSDDIEEDFEEIMPLQTGADDSDDEDQGSGNDDHEDSDEDSDEDSEEDSDEEGDDDDADEDEDDNEEDGRHASALGWGAKKRNLYGGQDDDDNDDELDEEDLDEDEKADALEAAEALELQRAHAARLRAEDFGELRELAKGTHEDTKSDHRLDAELAELPLALRQQGGMQVESVARDLSGLKEAELNRAIQADAPELNSLLSDFQDTLHEARTRVAPLLAAARQHKLPPDSGIQLLQVKLQLMLSYSTNLSFYLMLKAQGRAVRSHPVIDALLRHRILLERIRPLETKLRYRLQKLLQLAAAADTATEGSGLTDAQRDLSERPNPEALLMKSGAAGSGKAAASAADEESGSGAENDDGDEGGLYRPPKMAAVPYDDEPSGSKRTRQRERAVARASSSRLVRELREELSEAPRIIHADDFGRAVDADSVAVARYKKEEEERRAYEETNFKRLSLTKDEKRAQRKRAAAASGVHIDELGNFEDFSHLYDVATGSAPDPREEKLRALRQYMNSIEQRGGQNGSKKRRSDDQDAPKRTMDERSGRLAKREAAMDDEGNHRGAAEEGIAEDPFYADVAAQQAERKAAKIKHRADAAAQAKAEVAETARAALSSDQAATGEAREVGRAISKNRGLTRERKKIDSNPRVKNREKFRKAEIRRKGQVRQVVSPGNGSYGGEATGIKKGVSHSTRFS